MKKSDSESVIRRLCHSWAQEHYPNGFPNNNPSFIEFHAWLSNTHPIYLTFRTATNVKDIVEMWFDQEKKWGDLECRVLLSATTDSTGHIKMKVILAGQDYDSELRVNIMFEAGQLEGMARDAALLFA